MSDPIIIAIVAAIANVATALFAFLANKNKAKREDVARIERSVETDRGLLSEHDQSLHRVETALAECVERDNAKAEELRQMRGLVTRLAQQIPCNVRDGDATGKMR